MTRDGPLWLVILAVGTGAGLGAVCRWMLSYFLNPLAGWMPWGTLASNAAGGLLIGAALAWTSANPELPPAVRLFVITGFLEGLTTFSTFSAEAFSLITSGAFIRAGVHMASHLLLSLTGTWAGWTAVRSL